MPRRMERGGAKRRRSAHAGITDLVWTIVCVCVCDEHVYWRADLSEMSVERAKQMRAALRLNEGIGRHSGEMVL